MNNTQFYFALGVPFFSLVLMYIVTTVSNRAAVNDLRSENRAAINDLRSEMRAGFADLRADLGGRLDRIEKKQDAIDTEIRVNHDHRLAVLEARVLEPAG